METAIEQYGNVRTMLIAQGYSEEEADAEMKEQIADTAEGLFLALPTVRIDTPKASPPHFYLRAADDTVSSLGEMLHLIVGEAHEFNSRFRKGSPIPICQGVRKTPIIQAAPSDSCNTCPHGQFGGDCRPAIRMFFAIVPRPQCLDEDKPNVFQMFVNPTSMKFWSKFKRELLDARTVFRSVIVKVNLEISVNEEEQRWSLTHFSVARPSEPEEFKEALEIRNQYRATLQPMEAERNVEMGTEEEPRSDQQALPAGEQAENPPIDAYAEEGDNLPF